MIDVVKQVVVGSEIPVGNTPKRIAISPDGVYAYVTNTLDNTVSVITLAQNKVVATILVGNYPVGVDIATLTFVNQKSNTNDV